MKHPPRSRSAREALVTAWCLALAGTLFFVGRAAASGISEIVVFGDSLSDQGNDNVISLGLIPNDDYHESRVFSNGAVWIERLASRLGVPRPQHSLSGSDRGTNYAYGGAETGDNISNGLRDLGAQIDAFIADGRQLSSSSLTVLWIGGNDLNGTSASGADARVAQTIANFEEHLDELLALGAVHLLVPNLPLLGEVPQHNGDSDDRDNHNNMSRSYNLQLAALVENKRATHPGLRIVTVDTAGLFQEVLDDPAAFGITNTRDMAHSQGPLYPLTFGSDTVSNPDEYVFWDDLHPTGPIHRLVGDRAAEAVMRAAVPEIEAITFSAGDPAVLVQSSAWDRYFLECSTDLATWTKVSEGVHGNGGLLDLVHQDGGSQPRAFYRVGVEFGDTSP